MMGSPENKAIEDFDLILLIAVRQFLMGKSFAEMLDWFVNSAPLIAPDWMAQFGNDEDLRRALGCRSFVSSGRKHRTRNSGSPRAGWRNRLQEAAERARFWIARLRRANAPEHEPLIELLEPFAEDPITASLSSGRDGEAATRILRLLETCPHPACHYSLAPEQGDAGPLQPVGELAALESAWRKQVSDPWAAHDGKENWLAWMEKHPGILDSFKALQNLVMLVGQFDLLDPVIENLQQLFLERGERFLRQVIEANDAEGCRLEWGWLEKRPALWLVGELATRLVEENPKRAALMEWLVLTLNPNDNQGLRDALAHLYVQLGKPDKAIALCERYPDDFAVMQYARALALYTAGQAGKALTALAEAKRNYPKVLRMLLARNPKAPRMNEYGITVGGDD